jgi:hypothetical protein
MLVIALWGCGISNEGALAEASRAQASPLVQGAPLIVSTTINAPIVAGRYRLEIYKTYAVTVVVDAGTIGYLVRVRPDNLPSWITVSPPYRDDDIESASGLHSYTFAMTPNGFGDAQIAFAMQDRGTWNTYQHEGGVAVTVPAVLPKIVSTTIDAPIVEGQYQVYAGKSYTATVLVASGNVTYDLLIEGQSVSSSLHMTPSVVSSVVDRLSGTHGYTFTLKGSALGAYPLAYRLRDRITQNVFDTNAGVMVYVNGTAPRIAATRVAGAQPGCGLSPPTVGCRYDLQVRVVPGSIGYNAGIQWNDDLGAWPAFLHNPRMPAVLIDPSKPSYDFKVTMTPTRAGSFPIGFTMRDVGPNLEAPWPHGIPFAPGAPVQFTAAAEEPGVVSGRITVASGPFKGASLASARIVADTGATATTNSWGYYSLPAGVRRFSVKRSGFEETNVVNVPAPTAGIHIDVEMEPVFDLNGTSSYVRYLDYSQGRTIFHVVKVTPSAHVEVVEGGAPDDPHPAAAHDGVAAAINNQAAVLVNASNFVGDKALGYAYYQNASRNGDCVPWGDPGWSWTMSVLGITGRETHQRIWLEEKYQSYLSPFNPQAEPLTLNWRSAGTNRARWDDDGDGASDVDSAMQAPRLFDKDFFPGDERNVDNDVDVYWSRTAMGIAPNGDIYMVVADGEGILAASGATYYQTATFVRDVLGARSGMWFDGGGSTKMVLKMRGGGYHLVNTPAGENPATFSTDDYPVRNFLIAR